MKSEGEMRRRSLYSFWICEGDANNVEERGFYVNKRGEVFLLANLGRPWKRERERYLWWKLVEVCRNWWNFGEKVVACGGRKGIKEKGKRKRN